MSQIIIARRYAKALINLAEQDNVLEAIDKDLSSLVVAYSDSESLQQVLIDTKISGSIKSSILAGVIKKLGGHALLAKFSQYLLVKRRIVLLPEISIAFSQLMQEKLGIIEAEVIVARDLSKAHSTGIVKELSQSFGKKVQVNFKADPSIIGGVITKIGSVVIDGSIRNQLNRVHQSIIRG